MNVSEGTWIGLLTALVLFLLVTPLIARHLVRSSGDPAMFRITMWGSGIKLAAAPAFLWVIAHFYGGIADSNGYFDQGARLAAQMRHGDFTLYAGKFIGDGATRISAGFVELAVGPHKLPTWFIFSFGAFVAEVMFYKAFELAVPGGGRRRYAKLLFFFPSMVFWTAAPSKDCVTVLGLGLAAYGGAVLYDRRLRGFLWLGAGGALMTIIRPNVALIALLALALPYPLGRVPARSVLTPVAAWVGGAIFIVGGVVLAGITAHHFDIHSLSRASVEKVLKQNAYNTGTAAKNQLGAFNSSGATSTSLSISAIPKDFYYVVMRPLPIHAHGFTQLASSLENVYLLGLLVTSWRRLGEVARTCLRRPYLLAALIFSLVWIVLFASIGNLGILARERTQLIPFLLVLVSVKARRQAASEPTPKQVLARA